MQISRLSSGKSFRGKRKKFIFNAFIDFKPMSRFENRGDVTEFGSGQESSEDDLFDILEGCSIDGTKQSVNVYHCNLPPLLLACVKYVIC